MMQGFWSRAAFFLFFFICVMTISPARETGATVISGLGTPSSHPDLAGGMVIDFEGQTTGVFSMTFNYGNVTLQGNNFLYLTDSYKGSFNVTGNGLALPTNYSTQEVTFTFLSSIDAFGFNFGGTEETWHLTAFSETGAILDGLDIPVFNNANDGQWVGISAPGITSARLFNTAFNVDDGSGTLDYVVLDNFTYANAVPEPTSFMLTAIGLSGLWIGRRQYQQKQA